MKKTDEIKKIIRDLRMEIDGLEIENTYLKSMRGVADKAASQYYRSSKGMGGCYYVLELLNKRERVPHIYYCGDVWDKNYTEKVLKRLGLDIEEINQLVDYLLGNED